MDAILIKGGNRLNGEVRISGAKNAALPMLAASLLVGGKFCFENVPELKDIESILQLISYMGAEVERRDRSVSIDTRDLNNIEAPYEIVRKMRASVLVLGPLVARLKRARVSLPGGCAIGARPINMHMDGLSRLGAKITLEHGYVEAEASELTGNEIFFDVPTVTGTENLMMAAALAKGTTVIRNAAKEPEIAALAEMLNRMGADISGAGSPVITIKGVDKLSSVSARIIPDRIETGTYMVAAALTGGTIRINEAEPEHLKAIISKLRETGAKVDVETNSITVTGGQPIRSVDIKTLPYPGFPTDMQAQFMVLMSVANGLSIISETIFENRFIHVLELQRMGAEIEVSGNNAMVRGVEKLSGAPVMASDLRASASLVLAGLVAEGTTRINRVYHLDRGYESIEHKFGGLGANIRRVPENAAPDSTA
ncbi:MAG: UDP-N-acetylglucosamine 1-carboxyvinyltransferase [Desulfobacteraceae bacterium]|nr:UDP-N-acetylglucosamine 1-carboxyvinyltransferase [Desulfobacteraceae bacterium]MCF8093862.1 UDP-N-acetylglucosamine 1-carboxyvinyltransferase [Desulfobacteraceae bacterium]